jgi:hypothetical protein
VSSTCAVLTTNPGRAGEPLLAMPLKVEGIMPFGNIVPPIAKCCTRL